jgi:hypothetical protein
MLNFDWGLIVLLYIVTGIMRLVHFAQLPSSDKPAFMMRTSTIKEVIVVIFWLPLLLLSLCVYRIKFSRTSFKSELLSEAKFCLIAAMVSLYATFVYGLSGLITDIILLKIIISFLIIFLISALFS